MHFRGFHFLLVWSHLIFSSITFASKATPSINLQPDVWQIILSYLDRNQLYVTRRVSRQWHQFSTQVLFDRGLDLHFGTLGRLSGTRVVQFLELFPESSRNRILYLNLEGQWIYNSDLKDISRLCPNLQILNLATTLVTGEGFDPTQTTQTSVLFPNLKKITLADRKGLKWNSSDFIKLKNYIQTHLFLAVADWRGYSNESVLYQAFQKSPENPTPKFNENLQEYKEREDHLKRSTILTPEIVLSQPHLSKVHLSPRSLGRLEPVLMAMASAENGRVSPLETLKLSYYISKPEVVLLSQVIAASPKLKKLDLSFDGHSLQSTRDFLFGLSQVKPVKNLILRKLSPGQLAYLIELSTEPQGGLKPTRLESDLYLEDIAALTRWKQLEELALHGNGLKILDHLQEFPLLKRLNLRHCPLSSSLPSFAGLEAHPLEKLSLNISELSAKDLSILFTQLASVPVRILRLEAHDEHKPIHGIPQLLKVNSAIKQLELSGFKKRAIVELARQTVKIESVQEIRVYSSKIRRAREIDRRYRRLYKL